MMENLHSFSRSQHFDFHKLLAGLCVQTHIGSSLPLWIEPWAEYVGANLCLAAMSAKDWMRTQYGTRWEVRRQRQIRSPHTNRYVRTGGFSGFGPLVGLLASLEESLMTGGWQGESFSVSYPPTTWDLWRQWNDAALVGASTNNFIFKPTGSGSNMPRISLLISQPLHCWH